MPTVLVGTSEIAAWNISATTVASTSTATISACIATLSTKATAHIRFLIVLIKCDPVLFRIPVMNISQPVK